MVLRHRPDIISLNISDDGWVNISELITKANSIGFRFSDDLIYEIVTGCTKQRFKISDNRKQIRANQGHSISVDVGFTSHKPPNTLFHGTSQHKVESITKHGVLKGGRLHVHLSTDAHTASNVGSRHGKPVVLVIESRKMYEAGFVFFLSDNGVWLTDHVPPSFITFL